MSLGDIILSIDGEKMDDLDDLYRYLDKKQIGDTVQLNVLRDGKNAGILEHEEINHDAIVKLMVGRDITQTHYAHKEGHAERRRQLLPQGFARCAGARSGPSYRRSYLA